MKHRLAWREYEMSCIDPIYYSRQDNGSSFMRHTQDKHAGVQTDIGENTEEHFLRHYPKSLKYKRKIEGSTLKWDLQMETTISFVYRYLYFQQMVCRKYKGKENTKEKRNSNHILYAVKQLWHHTAVRPLCSLCCAPTRLIQISG